MRVITGWPCHCRGPFVALLLCCTLRSLAALRVCAAACPPGRCQRCIRYFFISETGHPLSGGRKSNFPLGSVDKAGGLSYCVVLLLGCGVRTELVWAVAQRWTHMASLPCLWLCQPRWKFLQTLHGSCDWGVRGRKFAREPDVFSEVWVTPASLSYTCITGLSLGTRGPISGWPQFEVAFSALPEKGGLREHAEEDFSLGFFFFQRRLSSYS